MTQDNPSANEPSDSSQPDNSKVEPPRKKRKKRWLVLKIMGGLILFLAIVVIFAPSIISTDYARHIILNQINGGTLNGRLEIQDWSIGWKSGIHVQGIQLFDANNSQIAEIKELSSDASLTKAIMGRINGDWQINGLDFDARMDKNGRINFASLTKPGNGQGQGGPASKLPDITGLIQLKNATGTFQDDRTGKTINFTSINGALTIKNINQPIEDNLELKAQMMNRAVEELKIDGNFSAIQNNNLDLNHLSGMQTLKMAGPDGVVADVKAGGDLELGSRVAASIDVERCTVDLHRLQDDFGSFLTLMAGKPAVGEQPDFMQQVAGGSLQIASGQLTMGGKAHYDENGFGGFEKPLSVDLANLDLEKKDEMGMPESFRESLMRVTVSGQGDKSGIKGLTITASAGPDAARLVNLVFSTDVNITQKHLPGGMTTLLVTAPKFQFQSGEMDLARLQAELGPLATFLGQPPVLDLLIVQSGKLAMNLSGAYDGNTLKLDNSTNVSVEHLTVAGGTPVPIQDKSIRLGGAMAVDLNQYSISIDPKTPVSVSMDDGSALAMTISGGVKDWQSNAALDNIKIVANYDLSKLWTMVYPMLSPAMRDNLKDVVANGKFAREFDITGNYAVGLPFNEAIRHVDVNGSLELAAFSTNGLNLTNFSLPLYLHEGRLRTVTKDQKPPTPSPCNGGTIDLGILDVDMTGPTPLLSMDGVDANHPHQLLKDVSLNPALSKLFLDKIVNVPAFHDASQSQGQVQVTMLNCVNIPLSGLALQDVAENKGIADLRYSITGIMVGSPVITSIQQIAHLRGDSISGEIRDGTAHFEKGRVVEDSAITINQKDSLRFYGTITLADQKFIPMNVDVPMSMFSNLIHDKNITKYLPDKMTLPMKGSMTQPRLDSGDAISKLIQDAARKALLQGILPGGDKKN